MRNDRLAPSLALALATLSGCGEDAPFETTTHESLEVGTLQIPSSGQLEYRVDSDTPLPFSRSTLQFRGRGEGVEVSATLPGAGEPALRSPLTTAGRQGDAPEPISPFALQLDLLPPPVDQLKVGMTWHTQLSPGVERFIREQSLERGRPFVRPDRDMTLVSIHQIDGTSYHVARVRYSEWSLRTPPVEEGGAPVRQGLLGHGMADVLIERGQDGPSTTVPLRIAFVSPMDEGAVAEDFSTLEAVPHHEFTICAIAGLGLPSDVVRWAPNDQHRPRAFNLCR